MKICVRKQRKEQSKINVVEFCRLAQNLINNNIYVRQNLRTNLDLIKIFNINNKIKIKESESQLDMDCYSAERFLVSQKAKLLFILVWTLGFVFLTHARKIWRSIILQYALVWLGGIRRAKVKRRGVGIIIVFYGLIHHYLWVFNLLLG